MSRDVSELLYEYALGALAVEERAKVEEALSGDEQLASELRSIEEDLAALAADIETPAAPLALRDRLLTAVRHHGRLEGFAARAAEMIDATVERARYLLRLVDDESVWLPLFSGCDAMHIRPGPAVADLDVGLIRMDAGCMFPHHKHLGPERVLILQGLVQDSEGASYGPGDLVEHEVDTAHSIAAVGDERLIYLLVAAPVEIEGLTVREPPASALL